MPSIAEDPYIDNLCKCCHIVTAAVVDPERVQTTVLESLTNGTCKNGVKSFITMAASSVRQPTKFVPIDSTKVGHESSVLKNQYRIFSLYIRVNVCFLFP